MRVIESRGKTCLIILWLIQLNHNNNLNNKLKKIFKVHIKKFQARLIKALSP